MDDVFLKNEGLAMPWPMLRIRGRLEEEDYDQVPQLATSLLIELKPLGTENSAVGSGSSTDPQKFGVENI